MTGDGLKYAIRRSVDCLRDSLARASIPVVEEDYARAADLCLERNRILGASVVRYSTGESSLSRGGENELLSGRDPGFIVIRPTVIWS